MTDLSIVLILSAAGAVEARTGPWPGAEGQPGGLAAVHSAHRPTTVR